MTNRTSLKLFGTELRTRVLIAVAMLEETFPTELLRVLGKRQIYPIQRVVDALECEGYLITRKPGVERRVQLNPRFFACSQRPGPITLFSLGGGFVDRPWKATRVRVLPSSAALPHRLACQPLSIRPRKNQLAHRGHSLPIHRRSDG